MAALNHTNGGAVSLLMMFGLGAVIALSAFGRDGAKMRGTFGRFGAARIARASLGEEGSAGHAYSDVLRHPCSPEMRQTAPEHFSVVFRTNYGPFTATCVRARAPVWVDRFYNLALNGYYDANYFFRVLNTPSLKIAQFGTAGDPTVSNVYNYSTTTKPLCAILSPQPPEMPCCMAGPPRTCEEHPDVGLSNTFGTIAMSTSMEVTPAFPKGVTWNATAELFINLGNNSHLDHLLFVPICRIDDAGMRSVLAFPTYGEVAELGGPGPSLGLLYEKGNRYIRANASWDDMALTRSVEIAQPLG